MNVKRLKKAGLPKIIRLTEGMGLTQIADEVLMHHASILTEGYVDTGVGSDGVYSGSTMITIDMRPFKSQFKETDWRSVLVEHLKKSIYFRLSLMRLARREAELRCTIGLLGELRTELEFKIERESILVDIDVIGVVGKPIAEHVGSEEVQ